MGKSWKESRNRDIDKFEFKARKNKKKQKGRKGAKHQEPVEFRQY